MWRSICSRTSACRHVLNSLSYFQSYRESPIPRDDDQIMLSATRGSQFTQSLMLFVRPIPLPEACIIIVPSHNSIVSDPRRHALHATPDAFLGVHSSSRIVSGHRECARSTEGPLSASSKWAQWRAALSYRRIRPSSCTIQRLGDHRNFRQGRCAKFLRHAT